MSSVLRFSLGASMGDFLFLILLSNTALVFLIIAFLGIRKKLTAYNLSWCIFALAFPVAWIAFLGLPRLIVWFLKPQTEELDKVYEEDVEEIPERLNLPYEERLYSIHDAAGSHWELRDALQNALLCNVDISDSVPDLLRSSDTEVVHYTSSWIIKARDSQTRFLNKAYKAADLDPSSEMAAQFLEEVRAAAGEFYIAESEKKKWVERARRIAFKRIELVKGDTLRDTYLILFEIHWKMKQLDKSRRIEKLLLENFSEDAEARELLLGFHYETKDNRLFQEDLQILSQSGSTEVHRRKNASKRVKRMRLLAEDIPSGIASEYAGDPNHLRLFVHAES